MKPYLNDKTTQIETCDIRLKIAFEITSVCDLNRVWFAIWAIQSVHQINPDLKWKYYNIDTEKLAVRTRT